MKIRGFIGTALQRKFAVFALKTNRNNFREETVLSYVRTYIFNTNLNPSRFFFFFLLYIFPETLMIFKAIKIIIALIN